MDELEPIKPEDAARELEQEQAQPEAATTTAAEEPEPLDAEPLNPEDAARELKSKFVERRVAPIRLGTAIAGMNLAILAVVAVWLGVKNHLQDHGALPYVVTPFILTGFICGFAARRKWPGILAMVLNVGAAAVLAYWKDLFQI